ncbi:MAG: hypothetical protein R2761_31210 [Acidimicrobiales bacterium]
MTTALRPLDLSPAETADAFWAATNDDDPFVTDATVSPERCLAWLGGLLASTDDPGLRDLVTDTIDDIRRLGRFGRDLEDVILGALASIEVAFEVAGARAA